MPKSRAEGARGRGKTPTKRAQRGAQKVARRTPDRRHEPRAQAEAGWRDGPRSAVRRPPGTRQLEVASAAGHDESRAEEGRAQDTLAAGRPERESGIATPSPQKRATTCVRCRAVSVGGRPDRGRSTFAHPSPIARVAGRSRLGTCRRPWCWSPGKRDAGDDAGRSVRRSQTDHPSGLRASHGYCSGGQNDSDWHLRHNARTMIVIDGSFGEGGGQVVRTSLALSLITRKPFRVERVRARREKPGLQRQHLTAVTAAAEVGRARVEGAAVGSQYFSFEPGKVAAGDYTFRIGTAGSTTLVLQTVLPPLMIADGPSLLTLEGGTHNVHAPPFDFIQRAFIPLVNRTGPNVAAELQRYGFYPPGGGKLTVLIEPTGQRRRIDLTERGRVCSRLARALVIKSAHSRRARVYGSSVSVWAGTATSCNSRPRRTRSAPATSSRSK